MWLRRQREKRPLGSAYPRGDYDEELYHLVALGRYFGAFYKGLDNWLVRRVDTIEIIDSSVGSTATKSSLMVDGRAVSRIREAFGISATSELHIPLPPTPKQLLGHFDAQFNSSPVPVLSSVDNAHMTAGILVAFAIDAGVHQNVIQPDIVDFLYRVASCKRNDDFFGVVKTVVGPPSHEGSGDGSEVVFLDNSERVLDPLWDILIPLEEIAGEVGTAVFCQVLYDFLENFTLIGVIESGSPCAEFVIKTYTVSNSAELFADEDDYFPPAGVESISKGGAFLGLILAVFFVLNPGISFVGILAIVACGAIAFAVCKISGLAKLGYRRFKLTSGMIAYQYYTTLIKYIPAMRLSGCFRLESSHTNLGLYGSQHYRLAIPEGAQAIGLTTSIDDDGEFEGVDKEVIENWVAAHYTNPSTQRSLTMNVRVLVLPKSQSILKNSFYAAFVASCLLFAGLASHVIGWLMHDFVVVGDGNFGLDHLVTRSSGSIVTVIMIAPSIYTIILLRQNEHKFVSRLLRTMRGVVGVCAVITASVAVPLALDLPTTIVISWWVIGFLVAVFSCWHIAATRYYHGVLALYSARTP